MPKVIVGLLCAVLGNCEPRLDTSSPDDWQRSVAEVRSSLPAKEQKLFSEAVDTLHDELYKQHGDLLWSNDPRTIDQSTAAQDEFYDQFDGMTAREVIAVADEMRARSATK